MQQDMKSIDKDQGRLRENMKALKGSPEEKALLQRYTKQLDSQEDAGGASKAGGGFEGETRPAASGNG